MSHRYSEAAHVPFKSMSKPKPDHMDSTDHLLNDNVTLYVLHLRLHAAEWLSAGSTAGNPPPASLLPNLAEEALLEVVSAAMLDSGKCINVLS